MLVVPAAPTLAGITIRVDGSLTVRGTPEQPVEFRAAAGTTERLWQGLFTGSADVTGAVFRHASIALRLSGGPHLVRRSLFERTGDGIHVVGGMATIDGVRMIDVSSVGVFAISSTEVAVSNSLFVRNGLDGIACNRGHCTITSCTFDDNNIGIYGTVPFEVHNSILTNNRSAIEFSTGSADPAPARVKVFASDLWANTIDFRPGQQARPVRHLAQRRRRSPVLGRGRLPTAAVEPVHRRWHVDPRARSRHRGRSPPC